MRKLILLDLFCGAGGAAHGYARTGFEVVGVDIRDQPHYPYKFIRADALHFPIKNCAVIHASPPCQAYTSLRGLGKGAGDGAPDLIAKIRRRLQKSGLPYVIENVVGAPMKEPITLCGSMFGLGVRRHRLFESNVDLSKVPSCRHAKQGRTVGIYGDHPQRSIGMNRAHTLIDGQRAMDIKWMTWAELRESIPPAFTRWIGRQLMEKI